MKASLEKRRSEYLENASLLLMAWSPAVSSFLGYEYLRYDVQQPESIKTPKPKIKHCNGCGTVMIPSWTVKKTRKTKKRSKPDAIRDRSASRRFTPQTGDSTTISRCMRCGGKQPPQPVDAMKDMTAINDSITRQSGTLLSSIGKAALPEDVSATRGATGAVSEPTQASSVSRAKRAKLQKSLGLQARLAKTKAEAASQSLDLMDFMKSG